MLFRPSCVLLCRQRGSSGRRPAPDLNLKRLPPSSRESRPTHRRGVARMTGSRSVATLPGLPRISATRHPCRVPYPCIPAVPGLRPDDRQLHHRHASGSWCRQGTPRSKQAGEEPDELLLCLSGRHAWPHHARHQPTTGLTAAEAPHLLYTWRAPCGRVPPAVWSLPAGLTQSAPGELAAAR